MTVASKLFVNVSVWEFKRSEQFFIVLGFVFVLLLRGRAHSWRPQLARTSVRRASGPNLGSMLGVVGVATLLLTSTQVPVIAAHPELVPVIVGVAVVLIVGSILAVDLTKLVVAGLGFVIVAATQGMSAAVALTIMIALLLWLFGALRGWLA